MESIDAVIARVASRQLGLITRQQAKARGMSESQVDRRISQGHLVVVRPGVYRTAACPPVPNQALLAACLAAGPDTAASHRAAAGLWGMRGVEQPKLELLAPARHRSLRGVVVHGSDTLERVDVTHRLGVPVTTPARTLFDLAAVAPARVVEAALDDVLLRRLASYAQLKTAYERLAGRGRRGSRVFGQLLANRDPSTAPSESVLEVALLRVMRSAGLPDPERQFRVRAAGRILRIDIAYPDVRLGIEGDSVAWHSARADLQRNAAKRNALMHLGWRLLSFTWTDATSRPEYVVAAISRELSRSAA